MSSLVKDDNLRGVVLDDAVVNLLMQERGGPYIFSSSYVRLVGGVVIFVCFARCLLLLAREREREMERMRTLRTLDVLLGRSIKTNGEEVSSSKV